MTYRELLISLANLSNEQLNMDVTVYDSAEENFYKTIGNIRISSSDTNDVLDSNHPFLLF